MSTILDIELTVERARPVFRELDLPSAESFLEHAGDEKLDLRELSPYIVALCLT